MRQIKARLKHYSNAASGRVAAMRSRNYWAKLKDIHKGSRGWVIGNGPSLRMEDLDCLKDEISIASNKIYLAYENTAWRANYVTVADFLVWPKIKGEVFDHYDKIHLPRTLSSWAQAFDSRIGYWPTLPTALSDPEESCMFSANANKGFHGGTTVTFENLQFACHLGLNPIYIIGCDHFYEGEENIVWEKPVETKANNHFHPNYRKPGEKVNPATVEFMNLAYHHARNYCDKNGIGIFNATRGGCLEIFERADLDSLLGGS